MRTHVGEDGSEHAFMFQRPGQFSANLGTRLFYGNRAMIKTALFAREHGAPYLRALSVSNIRSLLTDFVVENYYLLASETLFQRFEESYAERVTPETKQKLALALAASPIFSPSTDCTLFPLLPVRVDSDFSSPAFFFRAPSHLLDEFPANLHRRLSGKGSPPVLDWKHRTEPPVSWLGVRSPALQASQKMKRAILGALALTPSHSYRYMFSGRTMWGGYCTVGGGWSLTFGECDTPPLMEDISLTDADHAWLSVLANKLASPSRSDARLMTSLEYFYRAWSLGPSERFPILCMALDAAYSEVGHATAAVVDGVRETLGTLDRKRLRDLLEIRASVIHGGAPDVYDSRKYGKYYTAYAEDPIRDMGLLVAACLRQKIFGGALHEHDEPYQDILAEARHQGRIPQQALQSGILDAVDEPEDAADAQHAPPPPPGANTEAAISLMAALRQVRLALRQRATEFFRALGGP